ncbi:hypothetical protein KIH39_09080 [Telmatocola sphagniphila]|uniref:Uncharacterized protein n=1 Tax=Telmatocola sphagniphila TaxID=1123043 RepID=A0A8E6BAA4_9BACT|nr:hypothetical protein [Telmatocola sphagniphila]QVL34041.1 hypothetical protein KIH39_09080 [Telmatocola sphagniphila]
MQSIHFSGWTVLALGFNTFAQIPAVSGNTAPLAPQSGNYATAQTGSQGQPQSPGTGTQQQNPNQNQGQNPSPRSNNQNFNAQRPYNYPFTIYGMNGVSKSLDLSQTQLDRLNIHTQKTQEQFNRDYTGLGNLSETERAKRYSDLNRQYQSAWMSGARDIFNQNQMNRYQQLHYQYGGFNTLADPDIQTKLRLTSEQRKNLSNSTDWNREQLQAIEREGRINAAKGNELYKDYQKNYQTRFNQFLTPEQQKRWHEIVGEPYNFQPNFSAPTQP